MRLSFQLPLSSHQWALGGPPLLALQYSGASLAYVWRSRGWKSCRSKEGALTSEASFTTKFPFKFWVFSTKFPSNHQSIARSLPYMTDQSIPKSPQSTHPPNMANHNNLSWKAPMYFVFVAGGLIIQYSDLVLDGSGSTAEILPMIHVLAAFLILSFGLAFTMVSVVLPKLPISTTGLKKLAVIILLLVVAVTVVAIDVFLRDEEKGKSMANPTVSVCDPFGYALF